MRASERTNERTDRGGLTRWMAEEGGEGGRGKVNEGRGPLVSDYAEARASSGTSTRPRKDSHAASGPLSAYVCVHAPLFPWKDCPLHSPRASPCSSSFSRTFLFRFFFFICCIPYRNCRGR